MAAKDEGLGANPFVNEFAQKVSSNEKALEWFEENNLFPKEMKCEKCDIFMTRIESNVSKDKAIWKCKSCKGGCGIRKGTIFEVSEVDLIKCFKYMQTMYVN